MKENGFTQKSQVDDILRKLLLMQTTQIIWLLLQKHLYQNSDNRVHVF